MSFTMRFVLLALPLLAACYRYTPVKLAELKEGEGVRMRLTASYAEQIKPLLGLQDARVLAGTLIRSLPDTLIVEVPTVVRAEIGTSTETLRQRISIPRSELADLESRTLDRGRTGTIVAVATVGITVLIVRALKKDPGHEDIPGGGGPEFRLP
jgi:hypothetical protein